MCFFDENKQLPISASILIHRQKSVKRRSKQTTNFVKTRDWVLDLMNKLLVSLALGQMFAKKTLKILILNGTEKFRFFAQKLGQTPKASSK